MAHLGTIMCSFRGKHSAHFQPITASTSVVVQRKTKKVQRVHDVLAVLWKIGKRSKSATTTQITNVLCYHNWFARSNRHVTQRMSHFLTHTFLFYLNEHDRTGVILILVMCIVWRFASWCHIFTVMLQNSPFSMIAIYRSTLIADSQIFVCGESRSKIGKRGLTKS